VPGLNLWGFLTPPARALFLADFEATLRGALPPVDLRAVCFVRAMWVDLLLRDKLLGDVLVSREVLFSDRNGSVCFVVAIAAPHWFSLCFQLAKRFVEVSTAENDSRKILA